MIMPHEISGLIADCLYDSVRGHLGKIALVAPAGALDQDQVIETCNRLEQAGIEAVLTTHVLEHHRYMAGSIQARLDDLYEAYATADVTAVWCLRGGYGCAQLLPHIDWARLSDVPLIGYSDITALLNSFYSHGLKGIHGPVACELARDFDNTEQQSQRFASLRSISHVLTGQHGTSSCMHHVSGHSQVVKGPMIGGNLTTLASLAGTPYALKIPENAILILEDVGESYYRLERSLWQLFHSADMQRIGAVCLGTFKNCANPGAHSLEAIFNEWLKPWNIPLYTGLPCGHGADNHAWPYGQAATLFEDTLSW
ncbi:S66 peptidase family protein [Phytohalomonas tamaricis]|uniref:S66 peptidase family protein n=1 Tax=Phytohalomonas tamaricis TaxID=2081032 RepID=UPI0021D40812|nr:LD-carboxypeptidase [Phytohalomonas tamaricis]